MKTLFECDCGQSSKSFPLIDVNLNLLAVCGINSLDCAINRKFVCEKSDNICCKCNSNQVKTNTFGEIIFFDVEPLKKTTETIGISEPVQISDIPE